MLSSEIWNFRHIVDVLENWSILDSLDILGMLDILDLNFEYFKETELLKSLYL